MSLLTHDAILQELEKGTITIEPFYMSQVREASVDLRLDKTFRVFTPLDTPIPLVESTDYKQFSQEVIRDTFLIKPGHTILGVTMEKITLPGNICAWIEGRSRFARMGLLIHISAGLIQPGISNHQVLEITNLGPNVLELHAGERICQLVFQQTVGEAHYEGKFQGQSRP